MRNTPGEYARYLDNPKRDLERTGLQWGSPRMRVFDNIQLNVLSALRDVDVFMFTTTRGLRGEPQNASDTRHAVRRRQANDGIEDDWTGVVCASSTKCIVACRIVAVEEARGARPVNGL